MLVSEVLFLAEQGGVASPPFFREMFRNDFANPLLSSKTSIPSTRRLSADSLPQGKWQPQIAFIALLRG
jgi:hypothetical protein